MKKNFIAMTIACMSTIINTATAQTNVSGFISANTTWTLAGSPYIVVGNALLSHGYTLTIDPGVVVKFNDSCALQIDGELLAIGTAANRITFTSNQPVPAAGDWGKIHFADTSVSAVFDVNGNYLSGSIMKYCDVMYGGQLGFGNIHIVSSSPYISNCKIMYSANNGILSVGASYVSDSLVVRYCDNWGLAFQYFFANSCKLLIQGDTIEHNGNAWPYGGGISIINPGGQGCTNDPIVIKNNYIASNIGTGALRLSFINKISILENDFVNNVASNSYLLSFEVSGSNVTLQCNRFINNQTGLGVISMQSAGNVLVKSNLFDNNYGGGSDIAGNQASVCWFTGTNSDLYFTNNIIRNNNSPNSPTCIFMPNLTSTPYLHITYNEFSNNNGTSILRITQGSAATTNLNYLDMHHNNFLDPNSQIELFNDIPYGSPNMYVDSNYWGSTNTQHIDSLIKDYFDDANLSVVYYTPILISPVDISDTTCLQLITQINDAVLENSASTLFPNPFTTTATLKFSRAVREATLRIYNMFGQLITETSNITGESFHINAEHFRSGVYVYEVTEKEKKICSGKAVVY